MFSKWLGVALTRPVYPIWAGLATPVDTRPTTVGGRLACVPSGPPCVPPRPSSVGPAGVYRIGRDRTRRPGHPRRILGRTLCGVVKYRWCLESVYLILAGLATRSSRAIQLGAGRAATWLGQVPRVPGRGVGAASGSATPAGVLELSCAMEVVRRYSKPEKSFEARETFARAGSRAIRAIVSLRAATRLPRASARTHRPRRRSRARGRSRDPLVSRATRVCGSRVDRARGDIVSRRRARGSTRCGDT